jgi:hypothetical protein
MAPSNAKARRLCTPAEWSLVTSSEGAALRRLTPAGLRQRIARTRRLRTKYRDASRRLRRAPRATWQDRARAAAKQRLFQTALERFEDRLTLLQRRELKAATRKLMGRIRRAGRRAEASVRRGLRAGERQIGRAGKAAGKVKAGASRAARTLARLVRTRLPRRPEPAD